LGAFPETLATIKRCKLRMVDPSSPRALLVEKVKQLKLNLLNGRILKKAGFKK